MVGCAVELAGWLAGAIELDVIAVKRFTVIFMTRKVLLINQKK